MKQELLPLFLLFSGKYGDQDSASFSVKIIEENKEVTEFPEDDLTSDTENEENTLSENTEENNIIQQTKTFIKNNHLVIPIIAGIVTGVLPLYIVNQLKKS